MNRIILTGVFLLSLLLLGWYFSLPAEAPAPEPDKPEDSPSNIPDMSDWQLFSGDEAAGWSFSLRHPDSVSASMVGEGIYEFKLIGPESDANTEITDGLYVSLQLVDEATLATYPKIDEAIGTVEMTTFNGYTAREYQTESELGSLTNHLTFSLTDIDSSPVVDVAYSLYNDEDGSYERILNGILESLAFTPTETVQSDPRVRVDVPAPGAVVADPMTIRGEARGPWYFEASFPVVLTDWDGRIIAEHYAQADGEWMSEDFVPFSAELSFESPYSAGDPDFMKRGTLILQRANPSGLPENDAAVEFPVRFAE